MTHLGGSLLETVVRGGYCVGCGACASILESPLEMSLDEWGAYRPMPIRPVAGDIAAKLSAVCPFADGAANEDTISARRFAAVPVLAAELGRGLHLYAGHVSEAPFRQRGSSGGMGSWILAELLRVGAIDAVIHVREAPSDGHSPIGGAAVLFYFAVSRNRDEVLSGAKSRYYPVELSSVIAYVRSNPGRYAVSGIPCFVKAVHLLREQDPEIAERVVFTLGLVCGHLKSTRYADWLAWQQGIQPGDLKRIDFRWKLAGRPASHHGITISDRSEMGDFRVVVPNNSFPGHKWGYGLFKLKACDFCDDVFAETADIVVGDAWLPGYVEDSDGTNIVLIRDRQIAAIVADARARGALALREIGVADAVASQAGGLRHRRDGLALRLWDADRAGLWRPSKRIAPANNRGSRQFRKVIRLRVRLREASHRAFADASRSGQLTLFFRQITPLIDRYEALYDPLLRRLVTKTMAILDRGAPMLSRGIRACRAKLRRMRT